ncbi:MAG: 6-phosphogluconolactonase [Deltaproteobacteria bacterium]|nr:6-phosphogluconolactonase [Deltaproteobacteria bacterium]
MNVPAKINICRTREELSVAAAGHVLRVAAQATERRRAFTVALSGGSLMEILGPRLVESSLRDEVEWSAWHIFWADERCVPQASPESNYGTADRLLFRHINIPRDQIHALDDQLGAVEAASAYESILREVLRPEPGKLPRLDLVLLGIGEDGHTASLFPDASLLNERQRWVVPVLYAPKPPHMRVTLTLPVINNARHIIFVAAGPGKRAIFSEVFKTGLHRPKLPAELVIPVDGDLQWFVDEAAAGIA